MVSSQIPENWLISSSRDQERIVVNHKIGVAPDTERPSGRHREPLTAVLDRERSPLALRFWILGHHGRPCERRLIGRGVDGSMLGDHASAAYGLHDRIGFVRPSPKKH